MLGKRIARALLFPSVFVALALLGAAGAATPALLTPDLDPFVLREDYWTAEMVSFPDGRSEPGSTTYRIEYLNQRHWTVTQTSHSFDPSLSGTTWIFDGAALTERSRGITRTLSSPDAVNNWIKPGLLEDLSRTPNARVHDDLTAGTREIDWQESTPSGAPSRTIARFDTRTRLPTSIEKWSNQRLMLRITFTPL